MNNPQQVNETNPQPVTNDAALQEFTTTIEFNESSEIVESIGSDIFYHLNSLSTEKKNELYSIINDETKLNQYIDSLINEVTRVLAQQKGEALKITANNINDSELNNFLLSNNPRSRYIELPDSSPYSSLSSKNICIQNHMRAREINYATYVIQGILSYGNIKRLLHVINWYIAAEIDALNEFYACLDNSYTITEINNILEDLEIKSVTEEDDITDGNGEGNNNRPGWIIADVDNPIQL